jgi:PAS domain S-box-containing protein
MAELRQPDVGPAMLWALAWINAFATLVLVRVSGDSEWVAPPAYVLGSLFPALILAGALSYALRRIPTWLLPGALLFGLVRAGLAENQAFAVAHVLSLIIEPSVLLVAAWVAIGPARGAAPALAQPLLPVAFVLLALVEGATAISWMRLEAVSTLVTTSWVVVGPLTLGLQIQAVGERSRGELRRARDELERRVEERTAQLRESEERFRRLVAVSFEGILIHQRGTIREVNPALIALFGYPSSELVGSRLERLLVPGEREVVRERIRAGAEGAFEATALRKDGSTFPVEIECGQVVHRGRAFCVCGVRDISERRNAEEERRRLERHMQEVQKLESLGVLAGGIAHDFNNLLTVILGNSRVVMEDLPVDSPMRDQLRRVRAAGEQAAGLVEQMLAYSGKPSASQIPLDLSHLVAEMLDLLRVSVSEKCMLAPDLEANLPTVDGDPSQLRQVILNLVTNASEAMQEKGGSVTLRTGTVKAEASDLAVSFGASDLPAGRYVFLEVSDAGTGMSAETRARIFEPFFTTKLSGRGLGLASVLGIVGAHGGAMTIASELGAGSIFRMLLPPSKRTARPKGRVGGSLGEPTGSGRILVVDDDEEVLEVSRVFLERSGFEVLTATSGDQGIELFRACPEEIDEVILDLAMPGRDGLETFLEIRRIRSDVPVIVISGYGEGVMEERFDGQRIAGFIHKPFEPEELVAKILEVAGGGAQGDHRGARGDPRLSM